MYFRSLKGTTRDRVSKLEKIVYFQLQLSISNYNYVFQTYVMYFKHYCVFAT